MKRSQHTEKTDDSDLPLAIVMDFLEDTSIEREVLKNVARVVSLNLKTRDQAGPSGGGGVPVTEILSQASAVFAWHIFHWDDTLLSQLKNTKILVRVGIGVDNVDLPAAGARGIYVAHVPDYGVEEVADSAMNHILNLMRCTFYASYHLNNNKCATERARDGTRLRGRILGLVGFGKIGKAVSIRAKTFGLDVVFYDPNVEDGLDKSLGVRRVDSLKELIQQSDVLSLHSWLDDKNKDMINRESLSWIKPEGCYFVNTARGGLVDEDSLLEALRDGKIRGAALDVVKDEPYPSNGPLLNSNLNIIVTPHSAFLSNESLIEMRQKAAMEVKRVLTGGKPRNCVNAPFLIDVRKSKI